MRAEEIGGTGQGRCSGSLGCNSLTAAKGSSTGEGCRGRGTHKRHHQIPPSPACAVILCPGGTVKNYETTQNWVCKDFLTLFHQGNGFWLLFAARPSQLPLNSEGHASGGSPHFSLLKLFLVLLTSSTGLGENFQGFSQPLCLFLSCPLPLLLNSSTSTRRHGLPAVSSLPCLDSVGNMGP